MIYQFIFFLQELENILCLKQISFRKWNQKGTKKNWSLILHKYFLVCKYTYFRMKLLHIFLFLTFAATLVFGDDCYLEESKIRRLEKTLSKISNKYNGEYELENKN